MDGDLRYMEKVKGAFRKSKHVLDYIVEAVFGGL